MPELPEVETTVRALNRAVKGLRIIDVWSNYNSSFHRGKNNIKNLAYFKHFKKSVVGKKFLSAKRRAKNIIINLSGNISVLVHMKMTGHFLFGKYQKEKIQESRFKIQEFWKPMEKGPLQDPTNRFIRFVFTLSNKKHLAFSDLRRFAKICYFPTEKSDDYEELKNLGPEPLVKNFSEKIFHKRLLLRPNGKIKQILMDQSIIAGIGNIYSDEILWSSGIHPLSKISNIPEKNTKSAFIAMKKILKKAIKTGGDSTSDFRQINGERGKYQNFHKAYRQTGRNCQKTNCRGTISRLKIGGRSAHFCPVHQKLY